MLTEELFPKKERKGKKIHLGEVKNMNKIFNECVGFDEMKSNDTDWQPVNKVAGLFQNDSGICINAMK